MSTPQHAIHGFILGLLFNWPLSIGFTILGALPDLVAWIENDFKFNANKWTKWTWYHKLHQWCWWCFFPPIGLHVLLDTYTHGEGKRWWIKGERLHWEIIGWITSIIILLIIFI